MKESNPVKKRILILENAIDVTGGRKSILNSSLSLKPDFEFIFLVPTKSRGIQDINDLGFTVLEFPFRELSKSFVAWAMYLPFLFINTIRLARLVKKLKIDLLIANDFYNILPPVYRLFGGRTPCICFVRFLPDRFPAVLVNFWEILQRKFSFRVIAVSEAVKRKLHTHPNIEVVYEGLPEAFDRIDFPQKHTASHTLLYLSNYMEGKGQDFALKSFAPLAPRYPEWKLRFVGGNMGLEKNKSYQESLLRLAAEMNIEHQVEWARFSNNVVEEYSGATIVLNFSNSESFSLTCLEAMAVGRAVISTDSGGPGEIIENEKSGLLIPVKDIHAMQKAMERLIMNVDIREKMGETAFYHVRQKFDRQQSAAKLRAIYFRAMAQG